VGPIVLKNFEISLTSLGDFVGISSRSFSTLTGLSVFFLSFLSMLIGFTFGVNLDDTFFLKELFLLSV